jgi:hypothetical protein
LLIRDARPRVVCGRGQRVRIEHCGVLALVVAVGFFLREHSLIACKKAHGILNGRGGGGTGGLHVVKVHGSRVVHRHSAILDAKRDRASPLALWARRLDRSDFVTKVTDRIFAVNSDTDDAAIRQNNIDFHFVD